MRHSLLLLYLLGLVGFLLAPLSASAQDEWMISQKAILNFYRTHVPEAIPLLDQIQREEGKRAWRLALKDAKTDLLNYREILEFDGPDMASNYVEQIRIDYRIDQQLIHYLEAETDEEKKQLRSKILDLTRQQLGLERAALEHEYKVAKEILRDVETELAELKELNEAEILDIVDSIISDPHGASATNTFAALPDGWHKVHQQALAAAQNDKQQVLAIFSAAWCPPCRDFHNDVLPDPVIEARLKPFTTLHVDTDKDVKTSDQYKIKHIPTFLLLDAKGRELKRHVGGMTDQAFQAWLPRP